MPFSGRTQALSLTLENYTVQNQQGNVNLGYTITINATLTNNDSSQFAGLLDFGLRNTDTVLSLNNGLFNKPTYSGNQILLGPGESVPAIFSVDIITPYFKPGPDVVVVWPVSNAVVSDSVVIPLTINGPSAIGSNEEVSDFSYTVYRDRILLAESNANNIFEQVRIYDCSGKLLKELKGGDVREINTSFLQPGWYVCEVLTQRGERFSLRFIR